MAIVSVNPAGNTPNGEASQREPLSFTPATEPESRHVDDVALLLDAEVDSGDVLISSFSIASGNPSDGDDPVVLVNADVDSEGGLNSDGDYRDYVVWHDPSRIGEVDDGDYAVAGTGGTMDAHSGSINMLMYDGSVRLIGTSDAITTSDFFLV